jgi:N-methylhydantoinase A/oxoprolinase/acetone carboxylase beta subunit
MSVILGIDSGGTYTDCVVIGADDARVLHKSKTPTTKDDLTRCLEVSLEGIPAKLVPDISLVCLSTTLATNAIVEGQGCKEGLILIGSKPVGRLPSPRYALVQGKFDVKGRLIQNIEFSEVLETVESFRGKVDAIAVSGYASVRCPEHELLVKAVIEDRLGVPVACAHELTSKLGYYDRTVTAVLNARLIPMIQDLMDSVEKAMARHGVTAPLMIVRGDGTLMTNARARSKPIATLLSGPAASAIGAVHLSGQSDCLVVDIGGTTTDIANVVHGQLAVRAEGAKVGGWSTQVRAAEVFTVGLGGDSRVFLDARKRLRIGPEKSISYSRAASLQPVLLEELEKIYAAGDHLGFLHSDQEAYVLIKKYDRLAYTSEEKIIIEVLRYAPRTLDYLAKNIQLTGLRSTLLDLIKHGVIQRISLTPTDIWHVSGEYAPWSRRAAELGVLMLADQSGCDGAELVERVRRNLRDQLEVSAVRAAMYIDRQDFDLEEGGPLDYFLNRLSFKPDSQALRATYRLLKPVVGIGAPSVTWLHHDGAPGGVLRAEIPEHAEVANAIGAAVAHAVENVEILIRKETVTGRYLVFSPLGRVAKDTLEEATAFGLRSGEEFIAGLAGDSDYELTSRVSDFEINSLAQERKLFVERLLFMSAHIVTT